MLVLSDLSGDDMTRGFREYFTGYPLEDTNFFALAKTWYAGEMRRPGCVWTHTILIPREQLEALPSLSGVTRLFRRPTEPDGINYDRAIIHECVSEVDHLDERQQALATEVLAELLSSATTPVLIAAPDTEAHESLVLNLWRQMPPGLMGNFLFSTGSLDFRTWEGRPFDLQIIPSDRWKRVARNSGFKHVPVFFADDAAHQPPSLPRWAIALGHELVSPNARFRQVLSALAAGVVPNRPSFAAVVETTLGLDRVLHGLESLQTFVDTLGQRFSEHEGDRLKKSLLGASEESLGLLATVSETDLLMALMTTDSPSSFSFDALDVPARAHACFLPHLGWDPSALRRLCREESLTDPARRLRLSLLRSLKVDDLVTIYSEDQSLLRDVLSLCPDRLSNSDTWEHQREFQRVCVSSLQQISSEQRDGIFRAIVRAPRFVAATTLLETVDEVVGLQVLRELNEALLEGFSVDDRSWSGALREHRRLLTRWLRDSERPLPGSMLRLITEPGDLELLRLIRADRVHSEEADVNVCAVTLAIGFLDETEHGAQLVSRIFERVHGAIMNSYLPWTAWRSLEPLVPHPGRFSLFDWDHGEKLRRALVHSFAERSEWPAKWFAQALSNPETRWRTELYCETFDGGRRLLRAAGLGW